MQVEQLRGILDHPGQAVDWLHSLGLRDVQRAHANLVAMAMAGVTLDLLSVIVERLEAELPRSSDADMALNNLERFVSSARNPLSLASLFERDADSLPILLRIFATSQHLSDLLITDPGAYDLLRMIEGAPVARSYLVGELRNEVLSFQDERDMMRAIRRFKRREVLRTAYGDIIHDQPVATVTRQISLVADAVLEAAVAGGRKLLGERWGRPRTSSGREARFTVIALGKLGGAELNYSSDIDLMFLYDEDGRTDGPKSISNSEYFDRLARWIIKVVSEPTDLGSAYRVDMRLRPEGSTGAIVSSLASAVQYYDSMGRTWERQAFVKARAVAGDLAFGQEFLNQLEPWIYRRYLSLADISGIKALKRRIEQRAIHEGEDDRNVKTGRGGIRDVEFSIQFLQLLNGGEIPTIRGGNTLEAIANLRIAGCLTDQEAALLETNYCLLRRIEHRLQIMFDLQTHLLPNDDEERARLAIRLGYRRGSRDEIQQAFKADYLRVTDENRRVLDHLLHDAFRDADTIEPEIDLILDPDPSGERIESVLSKYPFRDIPRAYRNLQELAREKIRFLSTRRCRHFLASIAPALLREIALTPDPDQTLTDLCRVSDSLGGKAILWELFSFNPPTLQLYVDLCASSPMLSGILTSHPGMIDELLDSLLLDRLPTTEVLEPLLAELCRGAEDIEPILHSFRNAQILNVGVRDILGKDQVAETTAALSDIAETCLRRIAQDEYGRLVEKFGVPTGPDGDVERPAEMIIMAMGKLGGQELNYFSDLDVIFLYDEEGQTVPTRAHRDARSTSNQHFFSEWGQRVIKTCTRLGPFGRLYEVDARLRPTGKSGMLATSLAAFAQYFAEGQGRLWERQALCKARPVFGSKAAQNRALAAVHAAAYHAEWSAENQRDLIEMRHRLEDTAGQLDLKRGRGGIVDVEFLAQDLMLQHGHRLPSIRVASTMGCLSALHREGLIDDEDHRALTSNYAFLRGIEGRLRLMNPNSRDDLPSDETERSKLARFVGFTSSDAMLREVERIRADNRRRFERIVGLWTGGRTSKVAVE